MLLFKKKTIKLLKDCQFQHSTLNCINKYRLQTSLNTTGDQITMADTVMIFRRRRRFAWFEIAPAPRRVHCVRQRCFHLVHFSPEAPHHRRCARQTVLTSANIPDVRVPGCPRSFDGWAEDPLAEPHRNKAAAGPPPRLPARDLAPERHLDRSEHPWRREPRLVNPPKAFCRHLSHSFIFCFSFLFLPLPLCLLLRDEQI